MVPYFGDFAEDDTVNIPFNTFSSNDPSESVTISNLAAADIKVHKDGHVDQIVTDGASVVIDFDSITGNHLITIDTSAHEDYATGSEYQVRIEGTTVDGGTINAWIGSFSIERAGGALAILKTLNIANGKVESDLTYIHGTALTETAGQLAAAFKKFFDVAAPVFTAESVDQAADNNTLLAHADYGLAKLARTGADSDTLETISDQIDGVAPAGEYDTELDANMSTRAPASEYDTEMARITGNVALASVVGALNDAAAAGEVTTADTLMQYLKQLINILMGSTGIGTWPAAAAPANGVSLFEVIRAVYDDSNAIQGKLPTNEMMGSSDKADHDGDFNTIVNNPWPIGAVPAVMEVPEAGSETFPVRVSFHSDPDAAPTITVENSGGTARDANLSAGTMVQNGNFVYEVTYTVDTAHLIEGLEFIISYTEGGVSRKIVLTSLVRDDQSTKVDELYTAILEGYDEIAAVPGKDDSLADKIGLLFMPVKNGMDTDATEGEVYTKNDAGAVFGTQTVTEDADESDIGKMT